MSSHRLITVFFLLTFLLSANAMAQEALFPEDEEAKPSWKLVEERRPVNVFLDPGHGGMDLGARGSRMELEKNITLKIARIIKEKLSVDERIEVKSSRMEDVERSMVERINMANATRAGLYLGIHAAGAATPQSHAVKIYTARVAQTPEDEEGEEDRNAWKRLNEPFADRSAELARAVSEELKPLNSGRGVDIVETDRLFLGGLAMPAVIVEPVDLSNPEDEIRLDEEGFLEKIADRLAMAIIDYLMKTGEL